MNHIEPSSDTAEFVFLGLFIFEMLLRMWALGIRIYMESSFNRFDSLVISLSAFEQVWTQDLIDSIPNNLIIKLIPINQ